MSAGLEHIRQRMADYLRSRGVNASAAWPAEGRRELEKPEVVVSLRGCQAGPAGFCDYLGERFDPETGLWEERCGRKAALTFGLDLYAPVQAGGEGMEAAFDALAGALLQGGPEGLPVREFSCGETGYDGSGRLLRRQAQAVCDTYLCAVTRPGGGFLDFELRGGLNT